jgi:uncharacterized membrane protein (DUF2068 family)
LVRALSETPLGDSSHDAIASSAVSARNPTTGWLVAIAVWRLIKCAFMFAIAVGAASLMHGEARETLLRWAHDLHLNPDGWIVRTTLAHADALRPGRIVLLRAITFALGMLYGVEGVGLMLGERWAEYLTVIATGLLIPVEIYEVALHFSVLKLLVLAGNVAIVWYLVWVLRRTRGPAPSAQILPAEQDERERTLRKTA